MFYELNKREKILSSENIDNVGYKLNEILSQIQEEFEDHLSAINDNTNEIQANFEYIQRLEAKIDKMNERLDQVQLILKRLTGIDIKKEHPFQNIDLTKEEKDVFLILYTQEEIRGCITYMDISKKLGISEELAKGYITNMIEKGVPIIKRYINRKAYINIDPEFKEIQAKENILNINQRQITNIT